MSDDDEASSELVMYNRRTYTAWDLRQQLLTREASLRNRSAELDKALAEASQIDSFMGEKENNAPQEKRIRKTVQFSVPATKLSEPRHSPNRLCPLRIRSTNPDEIAAKHWVGRLTQHSGLSILDTRDVSSGMAQHGVNDAFIVLRSPETEFGELHPWMAARRPRSPSPPTSPGPQLAHVETYDFEPAPRRPPRASPPIHEGRCVTSTLGTGRSPDVSPVVGFHGGPCRSGPGCAVDNAVDDPEDASLARRTAAMLDELLNHMRLSHDPVLHSGGSASGSSPPQIVRRQLPSSGTPARRPSVLLRDFIP